MSRVRLSDEILFIDVSGGSLSMDEFVARRELGRAELEASAEASHGPLAAAAAVVNVSWGWDESEAFEITVNATRYRVVVDYFGDATWCYSCVELRAP